MRSALRSHSVPCGFRYGANRAEVLETIGVAIYMGGGPSYVDGAAALDAFDQLSGA